MGYSVRYLLLIFILFLLGCAPVSDSGDGGRTDRNLIGIWRRDDDSSLTDSFGDERIEFYDNGSVTYGDYLDPDGPGPDVFQWVNYSFGYIWTNGYYHDYRLSPPPNNFVSGNVLATDGNANTFLLFQYRYSSYSGEIEVLSLNGYGGIWQRQ